MEQLVDYVKKALEQGHSPRKIRKALIETGHDKESITYAFEVARLAQATDYQEEKPEELKGYCSDLTVFLRAPL